MAIPGIETSLRFAAQLLGKSSTHPVIVAASAVVVAALHVIDIAQDQEMALQLELNLLQKTIDTYRDLRELKGQTRQEFLNSLTTIENTLNVAARVLPEAGQKQHGKVAEYNSSLESVLASVEMIHAEYAAGQRFDRHLNSALELSDHISNTMPNEELEQFVRNMLNFRDAKKTFEGGTR